MFLRDLAAKSKPTLTHRWFASLGDKLLRLYTQNIDMLEDKAGLKTGLGRQFNCVQLHGTIANLQCYLCKEVYPWETFRDELEGRWTDNLGQTIRSTGPCLWLYGGIRESN
ncbi:hypothetical protein GE09DRAFT_980714 [Coniochaeta sp. 2T2.1]|nr:hypothetical protein GE09DRAFT_980714 [Coniochaeta sp. 2T2.1]